MFFFLGENFVEFRFVGSDDGFIDFKIVDSVLLLELLMKDKMFLVVFFLGVF